jgi:hypothetical protein
LLAENRAALGYAMLEPRVPGGNEIIRDAAAQEVTVRRQFTVKSNVHDALSLAASQPPQLN